ncbi:RNA ligase family protein [Paenibacillus contaminans]|uniref:ATP-dependent DNA ligase n=1 Tax=Paenibacillus contaminans TaxID=450362 RepID=A0A329MGR0_9BACL|nr:RNA ligase family protein [Paenibacillus contaminans]RAV18808.1 ATP-dependent DNA ligase [Paenibacillus contaminans]
MFISPMLLETAHAPFTDDNYIFEPKIDGHRLILSHVNGQTRLYTRHNNDCTRQYPELASFTFDGDIILDGEVACTDPQTGVIDFEMVMERFSARKPDKIVKLSAALPVNFLVFDILRFKGIDLRGRALKDRKEILSAADLSCCPFIGKIPFIEDEGVTLYQQIRARKMEGIVAKRKNSIYVSNRSAAWQKIINWQYEDVYITGYRKSEFGWLASVPGNDGRLRPAGIIELGVSPRHKMAFYSVCKSLVTREEKDFVYLEPRIKACVKIRNWTRNGMLRSPALVDFVL